ncbi:hypothetical protein [Agaribacter flavus]|uniref:DNA-directed DNA polymerase n=1 Tax=Agaribacter flavus TaxID=1902781 RepID=A0ABV7FQ98_9ALTE
MYPWLTHSLANFIALLDKARLHHANLLYSQKGSGSEVLSHALAKSILCLDSQQRTSKQGACGECKSCLLVEAESHPDLHLITRDKTQISVDSIRSAIEKVSKTAQLGGNKVILINNIESMSAAASNAFLKTLEEPTDDTYMVLSSCEVNHILPTILSRCEKHKLNMPTYEQSAAFLLAQNVEVPEESTLRAHGGSPLLYLSTLEEGGLRFDTFKNDWQSFVSPLSQVSISAFELSEKYKEKAADVLDWLYAIITEEMNKQFDNSQVDIIAISDWQQCQLAEAKRKVQQVGVNNSVVLGQLFSSYKQLNSKVEQ